MNIRPVEMKRKKTSTYGHPSLLMSSIEDETTEMRKLQDNLSKESLINKYISLCGSITQGFCIIQQVGNTEGGIVDWVIKEANPAFEKHTGLENVTGRSIKEFIPETYRKWLKHYEHLSAGSQPFKFFDFSDDLEKWFEGSIFIFGEPEDHEAAILFTDVTEKKKAEDELNESRKRYQDLIETNYDFIWEMDKEGVYTYCSPQIEKLWGFRAESVLGRSSMDNLPPEEKQRAAGLFYEAVVSPANFSGFESISYNKNGEIVYIETSGTPFFNAVGELIGFRGITRDITARKKTELEYEKSQQALAASEAKFRTIVETANEGVCLLDENLIIRYTNEKLSEIMEFSQEELQGRSVLEFLKKKERKRIGKVLIKIDHYGKKDFDIKMTKKDGSTLEVQIKASVIRQGNENQRGYLGMITDVSAAAAIERDLKSTKKKLEIALDNGKIGTWEWNIQTNKVVWDTRMEEMFDMKPGTFGGVRSAFEDCVHEEDLPHVRNAIRESLFEGKPYEVIYRTKPVDGKSHYIKSKALIVHNQKGKPVCLSGVAFDITDMKEGNEKVLMELNEELLRSNSDLRQFAVVASHDLQEPLRMIASYTQLLKQKYSDKLDNDANDYIEFAVNGSKRMYEMINGLLAYSRINSMDTQFRSVDMNIILERVRNNLVMLRKDKNAEIHSDKLPVLFADEHQMMQLMQNLIENSIKFSKATPKIHITSRNEGNNYLISVRDEGIGIDPRYFEKIFRIFQRLHTQEFYKGPGVGLAICRRIVERHSGKIWVESEPGMGSSFIFSIPIK